MAIMTAEIQDPNSQDIQGGWNEALAAGSVAEATAHFALLCTAR